VVQDFQVAYKRKKAVVSPSVEAGGFAFKLELEIKREEEEKSAGLYLRVSLMKDSHLIDADVTVACTFVATHGDEELQRHQMEHTYELNKSKVSSKGYWYPGLAVISSRSSDFCR
jgi:hypothetical protein